MNPDNEFSIIEKRDEAQIIAEMQGQVIEEYFYTSKGKTIISYTGVKEISREYGNNDADLVELKETETAWIVVTKATDLERNITRGGISTQNKLEKVYTYIGSGSDRRRVVDGEGKEVFTLEPDEFCIQKAFSKSQRNALKAILPVTIITKAIDLWNAQKRGGGSTSSNKPRNKPQRREASEVNVTEFMEPAKIRTPDIALIDELNRAEDNWSLALNLTKTWMEAANLNPEDFTIVVDNMKLTVAPKKAVPKEMKAKLEQVMAHGGFLPAKIKKVDGFRMNKTAVTG